MVFTELDDSSWELIKPLLPPQKLKTGRPRKNPRNLFNGILYVLKTECIWSNVPKKYGTKSTVHRYHLELAKLEIYNKIFEIMLSKGYKLDNIDLSYCSIDIKNILAKKYKL
ncbi:MAG: transposase [Methanotrichaceae archaeon]